MGLELTRFSLAAQAEGPPSRLRPWTTTPGVALLARSAIVERSISDADARMELAAIGDLLARAPLDSDAWATAAELCLAAQGPLAKCLRGLTMSNLTGPNEGGVMAARAVLALPLWDRLPAQNRRFAATDLAGGWESVLDRERVALRELISRADEATRAGLFSELLRAEGGVSVSAALGLASTTRASRATMENDNGR